MAQIKEKPLKTPDQNNPQIREYIDAIERGKNAIHVLPAGGRWKLKKIGGDDLGVFDTKEDAALAAGNFLRSGASGEIITHDRRGLISDRATSVK